MAAGCELDLRLVETVGHRLRGSERGERVARSREAIEAAVAAGRRRHHRCEPSRKPILRTDHAAVEVSQDPVVQGPLMVPARRMG